ncbi:MAG: FAD:protein FMN transferase [Planctomycetota bacterium]|jgi:thiamine biosynthesis lipoprotein
MNADSLRPSRRELLVMATGAFVVAMLPLARGRRRRLVRRTLPVMGTLAELAALHDDEHTARRALDAAFAQLRRVDARMSRFRGDSDVGRANAHAARTAVEVDADTARVVAHALAWAEWSDGAFDPCLGRATRLWDVTRRHAPPPAEALAGLADRGLWHALELRPSGHVRYADPRVALDLGGCAKGHAVDRAAQALRAHGVSDGYVNVGGDLVALGHSEDGDGWRVGVRDPSDPSRLCATLQATDEAVATSGDYSRYFIHGGRRYHHLLDPTTAAPRVGTRHSLTIRAPDCSTADTAATALFGMDVETARSLLARHAPRAVIMT